MTEVKFNGYRFHLDGSILILSIPNRGRGVIYTNDIYSIVEDQNQIIIKTNQCNYIGEFSSTEPVKKLFDMYITLLEKNHREMSITGNILGE